MTDKKVGVIGSGSHGVAEAVFLRGFTEDITLIAPDRAHDLGAEDRARLERVRHRTASTGPARRSPRPATASPSPRPMASTAFDSVYPALGSDTHTELAEQVGAELSGDTGCIIVDSHQRTSVPGLYAAGDVVLGLDQISHAMGEGGVAATTIRNDLAKERPILREKLRGNSIR